MIRRLLVVFNLLAVAIPAFSQICDTSLWSPNGPVNSIVLRDSLLYVGGSFDQVSPVTGRFVRLDSVTGQLSPAFPFVSGIVYCMARDSFGRLYVGGDFVTAGNLNRKNLFRLDTNGNIDMQFHPDPSGPVHCITSTGSYVFFGGDFTSFDGYARSRGASMSVIPGNDSLTDFDAQANGTIYAIHIPDPLTVIIGGNFTQSGGGSPILFLEKLRFNTGNYVPFGNSFWAAQPGLNGIVRAIHEQNGLLYIAGDFTAFGTIVRKGLAVLESSTGYLLSTDTNNLPAYDGGINGTVSDMEIFDGKIYIGGSFGVVDGNFRSNLACLDMMLNVLPWNPSASKQVYTIQPSDDHTLLYIGGDFHLVGGDTLYYGAIVDTSGLVQNWNPRFDGKVYALMPFLPGKVYAGGSFAGLGGVYRDNLFAININTRRPVSWRPDPDYEVHTLYCNATDLFVSGDFLQISEQPRNHLASFDLASLALTAFNPGVNGMVRTMAGDQSKLFIGGNFSVAGGQARSNIACIDIASSQSTIWNPGCAGTANKLILDQNWLYVGGFFSQVGGQPRANLARVNATTAVTDWYWICDTDNGVYDLELYNGALYFGGWFDHAAGQPRTYAASADTLSGALSGFNPGFNDYVRCFARWNDDLFISGPFTSVAASVFNPRQVNYDLGDNQFDSWYTAPDVMPVTMQASQNWLYTGGGFRTIGLHFHPHLAMLSINYVTGIETSENHSGFAMQLWPNPANDFLYLTLPRDFSVAEYEIQITDVNGKIVYEEKRNAVFASGPLTIPVGTLSSGIYLLSLKENGAVISAQKFIRN